MSKQMDSGPIICLKCDTSFTRKSGLNRHFRKFHPYDYVDDTRKRQKCGICGATFSYISQLHKHFENEHNVSLNFTNETFYTEDDFVEWKQKIEKEGNSSFVLVRHYELCTGEKVSHYKCHRSGFSNPIKNQKRRAKVSGSIKSGCSCPALIKVSTQTVDDISEIKVLYQSVHVGHNLEVGKLRLSKDERTALASSLNQGIPMSRILDEIKQYSPSGRFGLITRKDLHNIARDFQIKKKVILHPDDSTYVDILVKKMQNDDITNPVLIYKPLGYVMPDYPSIGEDDFLLGIMNEAQEKLLGLYGNSCIMIDSTHKTNEYGFELTTILVHDGNNEGLPVATLFSSKTSAEAIRPFFAEIKKRLPNLYTNIILTDDTNSFYYAWQATFKDDAKHLLCSWHVNKNWNNNVNAKVKDITKREKIKKHLKSILSEADLTSFRTNVVNFIRTYGKDEEFFVDYFRNTYLERAQKWAYCYRQGLGINANMKLERWHRMLKFEEGGGRLDKAIYVVISAIAKKLLSREICLKTDKLLSRVVLIRKMHELSLAMNENYNFLECDNKYVVIKVENSSMFAYNVEKSNKSCKCMVKCDECNICIHSFSCTCIVYAIKFVICKHIHYVCKRLGLPQSLPLVESVQCDMYSDGLIMDTYEQKEKKVFKKDTVVSTLKKQSSAAAANQTILKETLVNSVQQLQKRIVNVEEASHANHLLQLINTAHSYLDSLYYT